MFSAITTALANPAVFAQYIPLQKELVLSIDGPDTVVDLAYACPLPAACHPSRDVCSHSAGLASLSRQKQPWSID